MIKYNGREALPSIIRRSYPDFFSVGPQSLPALDSPHSAVRGDLKHRSTLPDPGAMVPVNGPVAKTILLSGERGSISFGSSLYSIFAASPTPPRYICASSCGKPSIVKVPLLKFTLKIFPAYPYKSFISNHLATLFYETSLTVHIGLFTISILLILHFLTIPLIFFLYLFV